MRRQRAFFMVLALASLPLWLASCEKSDPLGSDVHSVDVDRGPRNPLLGKPLKPFVTVDPEGNVIDLNKYLGKNVIMLDFWATWCGPCLMAMPDVEAVAKKYKDQGLVFFAVNVGEDPDTVREFLAQNRLDIPVAMDFEGQIQSMYEAADLPHTIVIGKDGTLQVDHRGYWQGFGAELDEQVGALMKGENLVGASD